MLITLESAKLHLIIDHDEQDDLIEELINDASGIVLDYLKMPETSWQDSNGEPDEVPYVVRSAVKLVLGALYENREGNDAASIPQPLSQAAKDLLHRYRDPAMA